MKSHIFDTENTFHTFLLLIPKGSMIRLNISEICIQWSIQGNNTKRLLVEGPRLELEWMNHLEFVTGLKMISTESNQGWTKRRVSAEQFWQKIGPFCGMIGWQPTILCNFLKYELDRASERARSRMGRPENLSPSWTWCYQTDPMAPNKKGHFSAMKRFSEILLWLIITLAEING